MITQISPTKCILSGMDENLLLMHLEYHDKKVDFEVMKCQDSKNWFVRTHGEVEYEAKLSEIKSRIIKNLLFRNESGEIWTYSGIAKFLAQKMRQQYVNNVVYPDSRSIPWIRELDLVPRKYQDEIVTRLVVAKHGCVEFGTGLGKSLAILLLAKHYGLKTVVMTPSKNICNQMYDEFLKYFGKKYVGMYGDGKKECQKLFVISIDDSLSRVVEGTEDWCALSQAQVFIADESHLTAASTLAKVCFGLVSDAPYRFFVSGTQFRNDGLDLLLHAITGDIVLQMTVKEGVDQGYLAKPIFKMIKIESRVNYHSKDVNSMTRKHLYYNKDVIKSAAEIANRMVDEMNRPVVILVEELEQFAYLLPCLKHPVGFAHSLCSADNKQKIPKEYLKCDPTDLVERFNDHEFPILVGTSCISIGTNLKDVQCLIYMQGGKSEIKVKQAIGRGTRLVSGKKDCIIIDFDVTGCDVTHNHAQARKKIYSDIFPDYEEIQL